MAHTAAQKGRQIGTGQRDIEFAGHKILSCAREARTVWKLLSHNDTIFGKPIVNSNALNLFRCVIF